MRPADDPDYQRLVDVTQAVEAEIAQVGPQQALGRRFDYDVALRYGMRRTEETSQKIKLENPGIEDLFRLLGAAWPEGFVFGALAYRQERRGRGSEEFLDRIALANVMQALSSADEAGRSGIFASTASTEAFGYVGGLRSLKAVEVLRALSPVADHQAIKTLVAGHWLDGFFTGLVFEEFGGHREKGL